MDTFQYIKNLTNELQENLNKSSKKSSNKTLWVAIVVFVILVALTVWLVYFKDRSLYDLILSIVLIGVFTTLSCLGVKFQHKYQIENLRDDMAWQTKLLDAYGKLLETQLKSEIQKKSNELKRNEEDRTEILDKKKHDLEIAKLDYEIERIEYRKAHIEEE